jgi:MFS transporter, MHS family, shikimate and dehydroshikimate transport protein
MTQRERDGGAGETIDTRETVRVAIAGMIGSTVEWYDFYIYGTAAALVFGHKFFPSFSPVAGTLAAFGTFAVGFVARPLGGVFSGTSATGSDESVRSFSRCS